MIERMKRIGGVLGFEYGAEEAVEEETAIGQENGCSKIREERWSIDSRLLQEHSE